LPEEHPPVEEGTPWRAKLESALAEFEAQPQRPVAAEVVEIVDPETRKRLEMLGY